MRTKARMYARKCTFLVRGLWPHDVRTSFSGRATTPGSNRRRNCSARLLAPSSPPRRGCARAEARGCQFTPHAARLQVVLIATKFQRGAKGGREDCERSGGRSRRQCKDKRRGERVIVRTPPACVGSRWPDLTQAMALCRKHLIKLPTTQECRAHDFREVSLRTPLTTPPVATISPPHNDER